MEPVYKGGSTPGMNQALGLPFGNMQRVALCFDIDGTLINADEKHVSTIKLLVAIAEQKWKNVKVVVWSGGGRDYAETIVRRLGLDALPIRVMSKFDHQELRDNGYTIIAIDDIQDTALGDVNMIVRNK